MMIRVTKRAVIRAILIAVAALVAVMIWSNETLLNISLEMLPTMFTSAVMGIAFVAGSVLGVYLLKRPIAFLVLYMLRRPIANLVEQWRRPEGTQE